MRAAGERFWFRGSSQRLSRLRLSWVCSELSAPTRSHPKASPSAFPTRSVSRQPAALNAVRLSLGILTRRSTAALSAARPNGLFSALLFPGAISGNSAGGANWAAGAAGVERPRSPLPSCPFRSFRRELDPIVSCTAPPPAPTVGPASPVPEYPRHQGGSVPPCRVYPTAYPWRRRVCGGLANRCARDSYPTCESLPRSVFLIWRS